LSHNSNVHGDLDSDIHNDHDAVNDRDHDTVNIRDHDTYDHSVTDGHAKHITNDRSFAFAHGATDSKPVGGADVAADQVAIVLTHFATDGLSFYFAYFRSVLASNVLDGLC